MKPMLAMESGGIVPEIHGIRERGSRFRTIEIGGKARTIPRFAVNREFDKVAGTTIRTMDQHVISLRSVQIG